MAYGIVVAPSSTDITRTICANVLLILFALLADVHYVKIYVD